MASIEIRPNDTLRVCWRYKGKQQRLTVGNRRDADLLVRWLDKNGPHDAADPALLYLLGRTPKASEAPAVTVGEALRDVVTAARNVGTQRAYNTSRNRLAELHDVNVNDLARPTVVDLWDRPGGLVERYAESSWRLTAVVLQLALDPYGKRELLRGYAGRANNRERDPVMMTRATMDLVTALGYDHGIGELLAILTDTGVRFGEAAALRGDHVEDRAGEAWVRVREQYAGRSLARDVVRVPERLKSPRSRRDLTASPRLVELAQRAGGGLLAVDPETGGPVRYQLANARLAKVSAVAIEEGLVRRPVHFHDFRHSWGAHLLRGGLDLVSVSRLLGHSSTAITDKAYGHLTAEGTDLARALLK
jgi:integrase